MIPAGWDHDVLRPAFWAGVIALDVTGFGPWMISQPLVCGPLFGWLLHHVALGVMVGGIVQLLWMDVTPVGVGVPYDVSAVTLLAVYWAGLGPASSFFLVVPALILAAPFGFLFRVMDQNARRANTWIARRVEVVSDARLPPILWVSIGAGLIWSWLRYAVMYGVCLAIGARLWEIFLPYAVKGWIAQSLQLALELLPIAGMGVLLELFLQDEPERYSLSRRRRERS